MSSRSVDVVLLDQMDNLGYKGQLVQVKPGYARNFLIPEGKATYATPANLKLHRVILSEAEEAAVTAQRQQNQLRKRVESVQLRFGRATTDGVNLYGPITGVDIRQSLVDSELALKVKPHQLRMPAAEGEESAGTAEGAGDVTISSTGTFVVQVEVQPGLWCNVRVAVAST